VIVPPALPILSFQTLLSEMSAFAPLAFFGLTDERRSKFHKVASVWYNEKEGLNVFWEEDTRQVFYQVKSDDFRANGYIRYEMCSDVSKEGYCAECAEQTNYHPVRDFTGTILWTEPIHEWWMSSDANILVSVAYFLNESLMMLYFTNFFVFDRPGHCKPADDDLQVTVYECEWSDFACEKLRLEFGVKKDGYFDDNFHRGGFILATLNRSYYEEVTFEDIMKYENELRFAGKAVTAANAVPAEANRIEVEAMCSCIEPNPEKGASTVCDAVFVGITCTNCHNTLAQADRDQAIRIWRDSVKDYRDKTTCCESSIVVEDRVGKIRCEDCWTQIRPECECVNPDLYRKMKFQDGYFASLTCGGCNRYLPKPVLEKFEAEIVAFVEETQGRL